MKNYRLYIFEFVFALLIIFAHTNFPSGELYFDSFGRITVLFFFILSGYFYTKNLNKEDFTYKSTLKRCLRLLLMLVITAAIYCAVFIPINWSKLGTPPLFSEAFTWDNIVSFYKTYIPRITFLWFIVALILCYLLYPLIYKIKWFKNNKYSFIVPLIILLSAYIYRIFCNQYDWGFFSSYQVTRNFLITGIPCFLIGSYIYHHESRMKTISRPVFYLTTICLLGTMMLEVYLHVVTSNFPNEFYISSLTIAIISFIYCLQHSESKAGEVIYSLIGSTGPTFIYLFHRFFVFLLVDLYSLNWGVFLIILIADSCAILLALFYNLFKVKVLKKEK